MEKELYKALVLVLLEPRVDQWGNQVQSPLKMAIDKWASDNREDIASAVVKNIGVPQNRERVFIIGHLRGTSRPEVFPIIRDSQPTATVAGYISEEDWPRRHEQIKRVYNIDGAMPTIPTGQGGGVMTKIAVPVLTPDRINKRQNGRRLRKWNFIKKSLTIRNKNMKEYNHIPCKRPYNPRDMNITSIYYGVMVFILFLVIGIGIIAFIK